MQKSSTWYASNQATHVAFQNDKTQEKEAILSEVGMSARVDFEINFRKRQRVQECRGKVLKAQHALDTSINIAQGCQKRCRTMRKFKKSFLFDITLDLNFHLDELKAHRATTNRITDRYIQTAGLV